MVKIFAKHFVSGIKRIFLYYFSYIKALYVLFTFKWNIPKIYAFYALQLHHSVRQMYGNKHYFFHLLDVYNVTNSCPYRKNNDLILALFHDTLEDCNVTYNNLTEYVGKTIADNIVLCTEYGRGKNREERKPEKFYNELKSSNDALFVKGCDFYANLNNSIKNKHRMKDKYMSEWKSKVSKHFANNSDMRVKWIYEKIETLIQQYEK